MFRKLFNKFKRSEVLVFLLSGFAVSTVTLLNFPVYIKLILLALLLSQIYLKLKNRFSSFDSVLILVSGSTLLSLIPYFLQSFTKVSIAAIALIITLALYKLKSAKIDINKPSRDSLKYLGLVALPALLIILLALQARTGEPILSIWQLLHSSIFIIYGALVFNFIYFNELATKKAHLAAAVLIYASSLTLSAIIFKEGFGFDPFIHRAAVSSLLETGQINPLTPLYSGQYAFTGFLSLLSGLSVKTIDIWLLPILSSILLPLAVFKYKPSSPAHYLAPLAIPYMLLTFTVPFSFTFLILIITAYSLFNSPSKKDLALLTIFNIIGIFWHPLILTGTSTYLILLLIEKHFKIKVSSIVKILGFITIPALIALYQVKNQAFIDFAGIIFNIDLFFSLFRNPFAVHDSNILPSYRILYSFRYIFPIALTSYTLFLSRKYKNLRPIVHIQVGLLLAIYCISTMFYFDDIIPQEQREFALRLLQGVYSISFIALLNIKNWQLYLFIPLLTANWFFTYPQYNAINPYTSPSVSSQDKDAVTYIHKNTTEPYIVLSNQIMAAAALETYGFHEYVTVEGSESLWYPIPTGAKLYDYYFETYFYETVPILKRLQNELPNHIIYIALHNYWPLSLEKEEELRYTLKEFYSNDLIKVYRYDQSQN